MSEQQLQAWLAELQAKLLLTGDVLDTLDTRLADLDTAIAQRVG